MGILCPSVVTQAGDPDPPAEVVFADPNLEAAVRASLSKPTGALGEAIWPY